MLKLNPRQLVHGTRQLNPDYLIKNPFSIFEDANLTFSDLLKIKIDAVGLGKNCTDTWLGCKVLKSNLAL